MKLIELFENRKVKRHTKFGDLDLSIEVPYGCYRYGKNKEWKQKMLCHYGYIKLSNAPDGDNLDCFLRVRPIENSKIYVIHQLDKSGNKYDEDKVMLGFSSKRQAKLYWKKHAYKPNIMFGGISSFNNEHFCTIVHSLRNSIVMIANQNIYDDFKNNGFIDNTIKSPRQIFKKLKE